MYQVLEILHVHGIRMKQQKELKAPVWIWFRCEIRAAAATVKKRDEGATVTSAVSPNLLLL